MGTSEETGGGASQINISVGSKSDCFNKQTNQSEKGSDFLIEKF